MTCLFELVVILHLIGTQTLHMTESLHSTAAQNLAGAATGGDNDKSPTVSGAAITVLPTTSCVPTAAAILPPSPLKPLEGVAVTLFLHSPTWFQRRNTIMINNIRNNLPPNWKVQIFWTGHGQSKNAIDVSPGVKRLIDSGDIILTLIPDEISEKKQKKKMIHLITEEWLWKNMAAPKVLLFGGNNVVCGNSPYRFSDFAHWDYIGAPWDSFKGVGGDGAISIRSRDAMLAALRYASEKLPTEQRERAYLKWIPDDIFFVKTMLEMNKKGIADFKIADRNTTLTFAAIGSAANPTNLVASGTLAALTNKERDVFTLTCPEIKTLYPSLYVLNSRHETSLLFNMPWLFNDPHPQLTHFQHASCIAHHSINTHTTTQ